MGSDACEALLAAATPLCVVEHMPQRLRCGATLNAHTNWVETRAQTPARTRTRTRTPALSLTQNLTLTLTPALCLAPALKPQT